MKERMMWAALLHLGFNMWKEEDAKYIEQDPEYNNASPKLLCDYDIWSEMTEKIKQFGLNTLIIDLGEGVEYQSHPEIAVEGSWSISKLKGELNRIRKMGIKIIPKLNFSKCHDEWLGEYSRCVSTKLYYEVCKDIINEVIDIFDQPEYFHLGMDEEDYSNQQHHNITIIRNGEAWWKDLYYLINQVEKRNVRSWIWSDYIWKNTEEFLKRMPKSVLQSNWYYGRSFISNEEEKNKAVETYKILDKYGYAQVPTGSNWRCQENFDRTVAYCKKNISPDNLKGFMIAPWAPTVLQRRYYILTALDLASQAKIKHYGNRREC